MAGVELRQPICVGLVGCSWFAQRAHVPALLRLEAAGRCSLVAVCSRTRKSMARVEALAGRQLVRHASMGAMFADAAVDVVLLVLPIPIMADAIAAALRAGKHVISEKPLAASLHDGLRLLQLHATMDHVGGGGRTIPGAVSWSVSENWAHKPAVVWLRERLDEGAIGRVLAAECSALDGELPTGGGPGGVGSGGEQGVSGRWRAGGGYEGGIFADVGVHWVRALRRLFGEASLAGATTCRLAPSADTPRAAADSIGASPVRPRGECPPPVFEGPAAHDTLHGWVRFERCASAVTLQWSFAMRRAAVAAGGGGSGGSGGGGGGGGGGSPLGGDRPPPSLTIHGDAGRLLWWARDPGSKGGLGGGRAIPQGGRVALHTFGGAWSEEVVEDDWCGVGARGWAARH